MAARQRELEPPEEFAFPFQPYDIQKDFMRELYLTLERGHVGIFESPTGTGKSLSIICGALKWLLDREERDKELLEAVLAGRLPPSALQEAPSSGVVRTEEEEEEGSAADNAEPDWFAAYDKQKAEKDVLQRLREQTEQRKKRREKLKRLREEYGRKWKQRGKGSATPLSAGSSGGDSTDDADIVLEEYHSEEEESVRSRGDKSSGSEEELEEEDTRKIYYCSRTHTQLAQFVREVQKSPYGTSIQMITLGSRQNLCINPQVTSLKSLTLMNDRCLEMQKKKKKTAPKQRTEDGQPAEKQRKRRLKAMTSCPFYRPGLLEAFKDLGLAKVQDIEQLVTVGKELGACPYYGTRRAIPPAQLVVLPYNTLLHAPTREAVGIKLKGNVVVIDEAHNLLDTISSVYSTHVRGAHVSKAHSQLSQYTERYRSRLKAKNLLYIKQLLQIMNCLLKVLQDQQMKSKLMRLNDFLFASNMDNINMFKILKYCERSKISQKLNGFADRYSNPCVEAAPLQAKHHSSPPLPPPPPPPHPESGNGVGNVGVRQLAEDASRQVNSPLMLIEGFLQALTNTDSDGRIVITINENLASSSLKFLLLNPSIHFGRIVREAGAVVVAGGTMQPCGELKEQLFSQAGVTYQQIVDFSCGHVIPPDHLLPVVLCKGPGGVDLEFSYLSRDHNPLMEELGRTLVNLSMIVPGGIVCFFPSYDYEKKVHGHWEKAGLLNKIGLRKKVFREPKLSSQVDQVLSQYAQHIERCMGKGHGAGSQTGALLLSVVGGKLSEGINFSDHLGRCVVMVGLPYPNITSPELKEKMEYLNSTMTHQPGSLSPGQAHYESLCMKAVNQSIGRAIRHSQDYALIVLADLRYERACVIKQLPKWIASRLLVCKSFGPAFAATRKFFSARST